MRLNNHTPNPKILEYAAIGIPLYDSMSSKVVAFYNSISSGQFSDTDDLRVPTKQFMDTNFPYVDMNLSVDADLCHAVMQWCEGYLGNNWIWSYSRFYFVRREDASIFALRWL